MDKLALGDIFTRMIAHRDDEPDASGKAGDATVLIADDSRTMVRALQLMLESEGYLTFSAFDGEQAVALARRHQPDVILMDIVMPNLNGFEATRLLVNDPRTAALPILRVSGSEQPADRVWGLRLGAKGLLAKPVSRDELRFKVKSAIAMTRRAEPRGLAATAAGQPPVRR
jgi:twitching motility two-component system response regulator PilH